MFSRLAIQKGATLAVAFRNGNRLQPLLASAFHTNTKDIAHTEKLIKNWDECNKKYYGPERDYENFPTPVLAETHPDVRLGFIPATWFDSLYDKTGVAGPFFTLGGLCVFLMSKEIMVYDHSFFELLTFYGAIIFITKKWGPGMSRFLEDYSKRLDDKNYVAPVEASRKAFTVAISKIDTQITEEERHKYLYDAQRENLDLQLEARYRERVAQVYNAVRRRLNYQVELVNTKKRLEQQHMVNWIVNNVVKGITPKQEKDAIASCISNLKTLSVGQAAV